MKRESDAFSKENILFLNQMVKSLQEASLKLESAYNNNDYDNFTKTKKFIREIQDKISKSLK